MNFKRFIFTIVAGVMLLSCNKRSSDIEPNEPTIGISVEFPALVQSKATAGTLPASDQENAIYSLSVWVYESDSHTLVASKAIPASDFPPAGGVRKYSLPVSTSFAESHPHVDIFALANAASIGCQGLNADSDARAVATWDELNDAYFGHDAGNDYFGITGSDNPVKTIDPTKGLPMSGLAKNLTVEGQSPVLKIETLKIKRAVSRMRFVFCKTKKEGNNDVVTIERVKLAGNQFPVKEYVFTDKASGIVLDDDDTDGDDTYEVEPFDVLAPANHLTDIAQNEAPEDYIYVNQDPLAYENLINDAITANPPLLTPLDYIYFRESDKRLIGWITYTVNGSEKTREFTMGSVGDFARNHTWTLLGFFVSGSNLQLAVSVVPWDYNFNTVNFTDQAVSVSSKFTVDEEENKESATITETSKDHFDVKIMSGQTAKGHLYITTPVGGNLMIKPEGDASFFTITPDMAKISPEKNGGRIDISVRKNPNVSTGFAGKSITLSFSVEIGERTIEANSEAVDKVFRFVL